MNPSLHSIKSFRSMKSDKSNRSNRSAPEEDEIDFEEYMISACQRFNCPVCITIEKNSQREPLLKLQKTLHNGHNRLKPVNPIIQDVSSTSVTLGKDQCEPEEAVDHSMIRILVFYDTYNRLTEISIPKYRYQPLPRMVVQLIGLVLPYYTQLSKFTLRNCSINFYTLYELSKVFPYTTITEVSLDECPLPQGNYDILLGEQSCIRNLSLCRCRINDAVCERLCSRLIYMEPAEENLFALNLSSNHITDVGATYIAQALRSNRHLRYLNLADNLLSDDGARAIFDVLVEFPLTYDEIMEKRHRFMLYLKNKRTILLECLLKLGAKTNVDVMKNINSLSKKYSPVRNKGSIKKERLKGSTLSDDILMAKAELMAKDFIGPYTDPYSQDNVRVDNGLPFCLGNLVLCYLNLAYNNLTYMSVTKLLTVVNYQQAFQKLPMNGLLKIVIEGNYIPNVCSELTLINNIMNIKEAVCAKQSSERALAVRKYLVEKKSLPKRN